MNISLDNRIQVADPVIKHQAIPAVFVTNNISLKLSGGGVQLWTQENLRTLKAAGFEPKIVGYDADNRFWTRVKRKLWYKPYTNVLPPNLSNRVIQQAEESGANLVFLNGENASSLAQVLRAKVGNKYKIVLFSVGLASVDYLHMIRAKGYGQAFEQATSNDLKILSQQLVSECQQRQHIDHVFCLAPFEGEIERWLGAKDVTWLPRTIPNNPLEWNPQASRLGFVGTLNHPPNQEGFILFLKALEKIAPQDVSIRLVGNPSDIAQDIVKRFPMVEYLGRLSDAELEQEARTWSCFLHPVFCYARGCSTKLAVALGWQIPIVTTVAGSRGYTWSEGNLPTADTPDALAKLAVEVLHPEKSNLVRQEIIKIAQSAPTEQEVALKLASALLENSH